MKINDVRAAQVAKAYEVQRVAAGGAKPAPKAEQRTDGTSLSAEAQELLKAHRAMKEAPEVRAELVDQLRREVESGTYRVDEHALARRLARSLTSDDA